jgi:hypothetical protein
MRQTKKGHQWYFGMKADVAADYQGAEGRPDIADDPHLSQVEIRTPARLSKLAALAQPDRAPESRKASTPAKAKHPSPHRQAGLRIHQDPPLRLYRNEINERISITPRDTTHGWQRRIGMDMFAS